MTRLKTSTPYSLRKRTATIYEVVAQTETEVWKVERLIQLNAKVGKPTMSQ